MDEPFLQTFKRVLKRQWWFYAVVTVILFIAAWRYGFLGGVLFLVVLAGYSIYEIRVIWKEDEDRRFLEAQQRRDEALR